MKKRVPTVMLAVMGVFASLVIGVKPVRAEGPVSFAEAFGAAAGFALYDVQVIIGITADALSKDVYTSEETLSIIGEQKSAMATIDEYAEKLMQLETVSEADKKSLEDISSCIEKLDATADALTGYVDDPSDDNADNFQEKRKASYDTLAELLGLEK